MERGARVQVDVAAAITSYWWQNRWTIFKVLGVATLVFIAVLVVIPRRYKAQATVIVLPPRFLPEVRTQPLTVSTVRSLLESGEVLQNVIDRLGATRVLLVARLGENPNDAALAQLSDAGTTVVMEKLNTSDEDVASYVSGLSMNELRGLLDFKTSDLEDMTVDDLAKLLSSEETVEKKTAADLTFSPLVKLLAIGDSGPKAQLMANTWATLFERMYDRLTRQKTNQQYESIRKQQNLSQGDLERITSDVVRYKSTNNLELFQRLIDENSEDLRNFSQQLVVKKASLDRLNGRLLRLQTVVRAMEQDGAWVGRASADEESSGSIPQEDLSASDTSLSETLDLAEDATTTFAVSELYSQIRSETIRSGRRLTAAIRESNQFNQRQPIPLMERKLDQLQTDFLQVASRQRSGAVKLTTLRETLGKLDQQLSSTQQFLTLSTSLPDEAIGTAIASGRQSELRNIAAVQLHRQEVNPVWQQLQQQRGDLYKEFETQQSEVTELNLTVPRMDTELKALQSELYQAKQVEAYIRENLERWQKSNEELFRNYVELTNELSRTAQDIALLEQEVRALSENATQSRTRVETYQQQYDKASAELQVLELRQRAIQRNADLLLQKVQEAQIAVQEDVSDVSVAARAIAPERHYFPQRMLFLLLACIVTTFVYLGLLARQRYMELQQA